MCTFKKFFEAHGEFKVVTEVLSKVWDVREGPRNLGAQGVPDRRGDRGIKQGEGRPYNYF